MVSKLINLQRKSDQSAHKQYSGMYCITDNPLIKFFVDKSPIIIESKD